MSLDKSIKHGKDRRKPYRKSKRFNKGCRNHGACGYCAANRSHRKARQLKVNIGVDLDNKNPNP